MSGLFAGRGSVRVVDEMVRLGRALLRVELGNSRWRKGEDVEGAERKAAVALCSAQTLVQHGARTTTTRREDDDDAAGGGTGDRCTGGERLGFEGFFEDDGGGALLPRPTVTAVLARQRLTMATSHTAKDARRRAGRRRQPLEVCAAEGHGDDGHGGNVVSIVEEGQGLAF